VLPLSAYLLLSLYQRIKTTLSADDVLMDALHCWLLRIGWSGPQL